MKKRKKSNLTKKEKRMLIIAAVVVFIIILGITLFPTHRSNKQNVTNTKDINANLTTVQDVIEYLESSYISMDTSKEDGYDYDIYVNFKYNLYENNNSKEIYFKNLYEKVAMVTQFKSFRIIDTSKGIYISVKCENNKIKTVVINGEEDYFKKQDSKISKENELKVEEIKLEVNSSVLQKLINANWVTSKVNLGTAESKFNKYDIYFDEGYEIRTIQGKVFNIVFTDKYNESVVENYKVGTDIATIKGDLGDAYSDSAIIGYKTKDYYIFFSNNEISVYPNYGYNNLDEFEKLVEEYSNNGDINDFMDKLTDLWPDYDKYRYDTNYVEMWYTLKGIKVQYRSTNPEGIQIYENYKGDLKKEKKDYKDVYYKLNKNLMLENEKNRKLTKEQYDNSGVESDPIHYSKRFHIIANGDGNTLKNVKIISLDSNYPNNEFDETIKIYTYVWADDSHLIYSIYGKGIYIYDAESRITEQLVQGSDEYKITNYDRENNIIEYDENKAQINF